MPGENIPFEDLKVGAAYDAISSNGYLVFRATIESSFSRKLRGRPPVAGRFLRSVEVMGRLLRQYPPESYIAAADYALAQQVYAAAPKAAEDPKLREQKVNRVMLIRRAWQMLEGFLTAHPDDPAADQAAFAAANTLLDIDAYDEAAAACRRYADRYPKSDLLDAFWYVIGYCQFAMGKHEEALNAARSLSPSGSTSTGRQIESDDKRRVHSRADPSQPRASRPGNRPVPPRGRSIPRRQAVIEYFTRKAKPK